MTVGKRELTLLASAARTATTVTPDQTLQDETINVRGILVIVDVTAIAATPAITLSLQGKDPVSGTYINLLTAAAALTAVGTAVYLLYPGAGAAGAGVAQVAGFPLPSTWRVSVAHGDADSITYSVGALLLP